MTNQRKSFCYLALLAMMFVGACGSSAGNNQTSVGPTTQPAVTTAETPQPSTALSTTTTTPTVTPVVVNNDAQRLAVYQPLFDGINQQNNIALANMNEYFSHPLGDPESEEFRLAANRAMSRCSELLEQYNTAIFDETAQWLHTHNLPATNEISCVWWD